MSSTQTPPSLDTLPPSALLQVLRKLGFGFVSVDLEPFVSGSMNRTLEVQG